jgi:2,3,4,5-tetrahydropyridine-2-carboxylate N-succinyltransferase
MKVVWNEEMANMTVDCEELRETIEQLDRANAEDVNRAEAKALLRRFLAALEAGTIRAASKQPDGQWVAHSWVKRGILLCFRWSDLADYSINRTFQFYDKDTLPPQDLAARPNPTRIVPGGTTVRAGVYLGKRIVIGPPSFINVGAYIDDDSFIDSHALVGSCAQMGKRIHLSAGALIGGVLEPPNAMPVIIEDDAFIGAQCGVFEGTLIQSGAVLAAGVILTRGTPVYDVVREQIYRAEGERPLTIPERAVVVPGARSAKGSFAREHGLSLQTPVIVRYREPGESCGLLLEPELR